MDFTSGFGRLAPMGGLGLSATGSGVATALAEELYRPEAHTAPAEPTPVRDCRSKRAAPRPANRNERLGWLWGHIA